jgi:hypothetical protein
MLGRSTTSRAAQDRHALRGIDTFNNLQDEGFIR